MRAGRWTVAVNLRLELLDELLGFVTGELAAGLPLGEAHWAARIAKVAVTSRLKQFEKLADLLSGCRWACRLSKRHISPCHTIVLLRQRQFIVSG
jgi:hypothetical protein